MVVSIWKCGEAVVIGGEILSVVLAIDLGRWVTILVIYRYVIWGKDEPEY